MPRDPGAIRTIFSFAKDSIRKPQLITHRDTIKQTSGEELGHRLAGTSPSTLPKLLVLEPMSATTIRVREAHRQAVEVAITELEKYAGA